VAKVRPPDARGPRFSAEVADAAGIVDRVGAHDIEVVLLSLAAALFFATSNVLEQRSARTVPDEHAMRPGLVVALVHQRRWLLGIASDVSGYVCQAAALGIGLLIVVQPILATGLLFSLVIDVATSRRRLRAGEWVTAALLASALGLFLSESSPGGGAARTSWPDWVLPLAIISSFVLLCIAVGMRSTGSVRASLLALSAGIMFGVTAPLTKAFVHLLGGGPVTVLTNWEPYGLAVFSIAGFLVQQSAFQAGELEASVPFLETAEPIVASIIGVVLLGERLHAATVTDKALIALSIGTMIVCAVSLARSQARREESQQTTESLPEPGGSPSPA
jgi:drug/metabolite transporter (DMT)-like permease